MLINVYMPCDTNSRVETSGDFNDTVLAIESLLASHDGQVIVCGDWNTDPDRQTAQTRSFKDFLERNHLKLCWEHQNSSQDQTYVNYALSQFSCIDHFAISSGFFEKITSCGVNSNPLNPSDHKDIAIKFECDFTSDIPEKNRVFKPKVAWHLVNNDDIDKYHAAMDDELKTIDICYNSLECEDYLCRNPEHIYNLDSLCNALIDICIKASDRTFPMRSPPSGRLPMWNERVRPLRDTSLFWHSVWKSAGRPPRGALEDIMRNTRAKYHRAVKQLCSEQQSFRRSKIADTFMCDTSRNFWAENNKLESNKRPVPPVVDGLHDDTEIAGMFAKKYMYMALFSSVKTDPSVMASFLGGILNDIQNDGTNEAPITVEDVTRLFQKLKHQKADGLSGAESDHFIYASHRFKTLVAVMLNSMFVHGHTPTILLKSVLCNIPKDLKGDLCNSNNYRGIALCSALCKAVDILMIERYGHILFTSGMQFAYKRHHSTNMCTTMIKEIASYYNSRHTDVFLCTLDASKAFDRVHLGKLFALLHNRGLPPVANRLLLDMYTRQRMCTTWNGVKSEFFSTENGVKQGGFLSPILFCVYIDELLNRLLSSGIGCHMGHLLVCDLNRTPNCYGKTWRFLCPFFKNLHLRENLARDCFTSTVSTVTNSVQNIFTHLRYCDK